MDFEKINSDETLFSLDDQLSSINHGANRMDVTQIYPISGNVTNSYVGQGNAKQTIFTFTESANWWCPESSYFNLQLQFGQFSGTTFGAIPAAALVAYVDNFVCTLFSQIQTLIGPQPLDTITVPHIIDTALSYGTSRKNFLDTWGSASRLGEPLSTRLINTYSNGGVVDVCFRPPVSILDCKILPPGPQIQFTYTWSPSAVQAFESLKGPLIVGTADTNFNILVNSFSFYKASVNPSPYVDLPMKGVVDLYPCQLNQYPVSNTSTLKTNISLPSTTNRVYVVFQDTNQVSGGAAAAGINPLDAPLMSGVGNGYNPATSFANQFTILNSTGAANDGTLGSFLNQFWCDFPEIGLTAPKPIYAFDTNNTDCLRAYEDWCSISQGITTYQGSVPFGQNKATNIGITYVKNTAEADLLTSIVQPGNRWNPQEYYINTIGATADAPAVTVYNQTSRYGWLGRCPGPIYAFELVRPDDKKVSVGTLNATFAKIVGSTGTNSVPVNVTATVLSCYSMALAVEKQSNGLYNYMLVQGV